MSRAEEGKKRRLLFIYNPIAGKGEIRTSLSHVLEEFSRHGMIMTVCPTRYSGDASSIAKEEGGKYDLVVCSGGDGTLDEVVTGMMEGGYQTPIGYIPAGSTNDFASSVGIPRHFRRAASSIAEGKVFSCDVGKLADRYFVYVAAFGAFTEVSYKTSQDMKNMFGHMAYVLEGAKSLPTLKSWSMRYWCKEQEGEGNFLYGMITNSNSVGGFKGITGSDITLNDGLFEVTLIREPATIIEWPAILNALATGTENEWIVSFKTSSIEFGSKEIVPWTTDGEYGGEYNHLRIENIPRALHLMINPEDSLLDGE